MKKIYLSLFLVMFLICQTFMMPSVFAEETHLDDQDIKLLVALNLLQGDNNGDLRLNDSLLRSEYTALILRFMGLEETTENYIGQTDFADVPEGHWARKYISLASDMGLINGVGNNLFEPDRKVNRMEAIKIMVCALGYGELAEYKGGFPYGYERQASDLKIIKKLTSSAEFTRADACRLMVNSLATDVMDELGTVVSGRDALKKYLDIEIFEGYVTGTEEIYVDTKINSGYIEIGNVRYKTNYNSEDELFGCRVQFYLHSAGDNASIYFIEVMEDEGRLNIKADDIFNQTDLSTFHYAEKNKNKSVELAENIIIYYNGKRVGSADMESSLLMPEQGNVILCDIENDDKYDLAIVYNYRSVKVDYISNNTIYDVYNKHIYLDKADKYSIIKAGKKITLEELNNGDILTVAESLDEVCIKILADSKTIEGSIFQIKNDGFGTDTYVIESNDGSFELKLSKNLTDAISLGLADDLMRIDKRILSFELNHFGTIAYVKLANEETSGIDTVQYGFLIEVKQSSALSGEVAMKILTADNRFDVVNISANKKVKVGRRVGTGYTVTSINNDDLVALLGGSGNAIRQLIQYRIDADKNLKELYLPDEYANSDAFSADILNTFLTYRQGVLNQKYYMDDSTVVFSIPENAIYEDVMSAGNYKNFFSEGWGKTCTLYDVNNGHVGAVVIHDAVSITYNSADCGYEMILNYASSPVFFINKSMSRLEENGEVFVTVEGYQNGKNTVVNISEQLSRNASIMSGLRTGSVIQYEKNSNEKSWAMTSNVAEQMVVFEQVFDFEKENGSGIRWDHDIIIDDNPDILTIWGTLEQIDSAYCTVLVEENNKKESYAMQLMNNAVFLKYDDSKKEFVPITKHELVAGQHVYIAKQSSNQVIVLY